MAEAAKALLDLLRSQRDAILAADRTSLASLPHDIASAAQRLLREGASPESLQAIRTAAEANGALIAAALGGFRAGRRRAEAMARARDLLESYDAEGRARTIRTGRDPARGEGFSRRS